MIVPGHETLWSGGGHGAFGVFDASVLLQGEWRPYRLPSAVAQFVIPSPGMLCMHGCCMMPSSM